MQKQRNMEKIIDYNAVSCEPDEFLKEVEKLLKDNWQPLGGMSMVYGKWVILNSRPKQTKEGFRYGQAFVKYQR